MKAKKTYFLVQASSAPGVSSIVLGNVILDPTLPEGAVNQRTIVFPESIPISYSIPLKNWRWAKAPSSKISGGIFAQFIGVIDSEISAHRENKTAQEYFCKELETQSFHVTEEYIDIIKALPEVQAKILQRESLYVITGVKVAKGATVNEQAFKSLGFRLAATVDLRALGGSPIKIGPKVEVDNTVSERLEYNVDEDFVFAYRLEEIFYRWKKVQHRGFGKDGDLHGLPTKNPDSDAEDDEEEDTIDDFDFDKPGDHDIPASMIKGRQTKPVQDEDGKEYDVVWMKTCQ